MPLLALAVLEAVLRLAGYGYPTGFFEKIRVGGQGFLVNNESFSLRFFPPQLARWPGPIMMPATKAPDTCRIFILGESAARGEPEPPYSAARYLEALLQERFPGQKFEIVNVAITAINSHVILPIARDLARQHGDLWIIYMGNNEMVGPFGAATVFGAKAPPLPAVRLSLALQRTRLGQLLMASGRKLKGKDTNASWGGMKMFIGNQLPPDDPRKEVVYTNFRRNLQDILRAGLDSGAKIILNTVAVNLSDCAPFASLSNSNLPAAQRTECDRLYADGIKAVEQDRPAEAERDFAQTAQIDPKRAELQFRWAECLIKLTNSAAAKEHFQAACDDDALPFRADSRINRLIREAASAWAGPGLVLLDAAGVLATNSPIGICGAESFYEHVHLNFDGNYRLGRAWAEQVAALLPAARKNPPASEWASQEKCEQRLGLTDWNRGAVITTVMERLHRPPLSTQLNNAQRLAALQEQEKDVRGRLNRGTEAVAKEALLAAIQAAPNDHWLHEDFAEFLESVGDLKQAALQWAQVRDLLPHNCFAYYQVGRLLAQQGQRGEAQTNLLAALASRPTLTEAWSELGTLHLDEEKFDLALHDFEHAHELEPRDGIHVAYLGKALSKLNRRAEAMARYREALDLEPELAEAHFALADELAAENHFAEAETEYEAVIRIKPNLALAHLSAGVMLARDGRFDAATRQFEETLLLEPGNKTAQEYLERVRGWQRQRRAEQPRSSGQN